MFTVKLLPEFTDWLSGLKDRMTQRRLARRLEKGDVLIVMLGGGDKSTQKSDMAAAIALSQTLEGD